MPSQRTLPSVKYPSTDAEFETLRALFHANGFVRIEDVFSDAEVDALRDEMDKIVERFRPEDHPKSVFSTYNDNEHASDRYFLSSVDKIGFFYEEDAVDKRSGRLLVDKRRALNKVGHALHSRSVAFRKCTFDPKIQQPSIGGAVTPHVDSTFLQVDGDVEDGGAATVVGLWLAIDDSKQENGCLWFAPGSHRDGGTSGYKFVRANDDTGVGGALLKFVGVNPDYGHVDYVPVEVRRGSLVLIHGDVIHKSEPNTSAHSRHAYTFHVAESGRKVRWKETNWLQETEDYKFPSLWSDSE